MAQTFGATEKARPWKGFLKRLGAALIRVAVHLATMPTPPGEEGTTDFELSRPGLYPFLVELVAVVRPEAIPICGGVAAGLGGAGVPVPSDRRHRPGRESATEAST